MTHTLHKLLPALSLLAALATHPALAAEGTTVPAVQAATDTLTEGEVRKVDTAQGKLTLRHGEIRNLDMPPMTMVFRVKDASLMQSLKAGDKVRFRAEKLTEGLTVTQLEAAR